MVGIPLVLPAFKLYLTWSMCLSLLVHIARPFVTLLLDFLGFLSDLATLLLLLLFPRTSVQVGGQ